MKIATIGPTCPYKGGISHYNTILTNNLTKKHNVLSISYKRLYPKLLYPGKQQKDSESKIKLKTNTSYILDSINPLTWLSAFKKINKFRPELLILQWWTPFFTFIYYTLIKLTKLFTKSNIMLICHNVMPHEKSIFDKVFSKLIFKNTDYFLVQSKQDLQELKNLNPKVNAKIAPHPIYSVFNFDNKTNKKLTNTILFFGFIRKYKGLNYLLNALPLVNSKINLLIVGEFWKGKDEYIKQINKLNLKNRVKIIDKYVPDEEIQNYFNSVDLVILPYTSATGSGIAQLALAFNKPCIATNVGALSDTILDNKTGFIIEPKNSKAIANAINRFYREKKFKEFIKNIEKEKEKYSWSNLIKKIESFQNESTLYTG